MSNTIKKQLNEAMYEAIECGDVEIVENIIKVANEHSIYFNYNYYLYSATHKGHKKIIDYFIILGADNYDCAISAACFGGHFHLIDYFINLGATDLEKVISCAISNNNQDLIKYLIKKSQSKSNEITIDIDEAFIISCLYGNKELIDYFASLGANSFEQAIDDMKEHNSDYETCEFFNDLKNYILEKKEQYNSNSE